MFDSFFLRATKALCEGDKIDLKICASMENFLSFSSSNRVFNDLKVLFLGEAIKNRLVFLRENFQLQTFATL